MIMQNIELADLDFNDVWDAIVAQYETETNHGQHKASLSANKISAVKHQCGNPGFNKQENQQQHQSSGSSSKLSGNQQQPRECGARGSGKNKKGKDKLRQQPTHSHVTSIATLPPPSSHTVAHIGFSSMTQRVVSNPSPLSRSSGPHLSLNKALLLAEWLEVMSTIQTLKMLEQCFPEFDDEVRTCSNYNHDDEYNSDIDIDMSQSATRHEPRQMKTNIDNLSSGELFELCSALDCLETESNDSNKEN